MPSLVQYLIRSESNGPATGVAEPPAPPVEAPARPRTGKRLIEVQDSDVAKLLSLLKLLK
ncbi:hypothetical protein BZL41_05575 [Pseudomonas sp. PIC25]|uniref:hypothetical protein n=1 Tax=Pseudomonas sp. PIC25 TaxID=1958773 RepID=UPI000BABFA10|nr:hypothetical protein [Pseudomonas sp. PIC25]PAU65643.1 hypothetical protein BZL41_05575 [Pseudomonas sp. PIC25]